MIQDAEKFIKRVIGDNPFRLSLYDYPTDKEKLDYLETSGFFFHPDEVEYAIDRIKADNVTPADSQLLNEILMWWNLLLDGDYLPMDPEAFSAGGCSPSACRTCSSCR